MAWSSPKTWAAGEIVTAALLNLHIRDQFKAIGDPWAAYTPAWTATSNPSLGNGTLIGAFSKAGSRVDFRIELTIGSTTNLGTGAWRFSLPATSQRTTPLPIGWAYVNAPSTHTGAAILRSSTVISVNLAATGSQATPTVPVAWATGDALYITGSYEAV